MRGIWMGTLLLLPTPAYSQSKPADSGNDFYLDCSQPTKRSHCVAYVRGAAEGIDLNDIERRIFCLPVGVEIGQMLDVSLAYIQRNPAERHYRTIILVSFALRDAFPCKKAR